MIRFTTGDIFKSDAEAIVNTVNTVGVMGKGLALQFKRRYPENFSAYSAACKSGEVQVGKMFITENPQLDGPRYLVNFPTKKHWRADSRIEYIRDGLESLKSEVHALGITSIAIPPLGAGNGGLQWEIVKQVITDSLESLEDISVTIFEPNNEHREILSSPEQTTNAPKLSPSKLLLMALIHEYGKAQIAFDPGASGPYSSHLEIQKLVYFSTLITEETRFQFTKGRYGPYSDVVRILLRDLEPTFTRGYGDGNDRVANLEPIGLTPVGEQVLSTHLTPDNASLAAQVVESVEGFESPYGLELLTSVIWAIRDLNSHSQDAIRNYIKVWNYRKGHLFTPNHIRVASERALAVTA